MGKHFYIAFILFVLFIKVKAQNRGLDSLVDKKLYRKNIKIFKEVLKNGPNKDISIKLAEALRVVGNYKESAAEYEKVIERTDINPVYYKRYSEVLCKIGDVQECKKWDLRFKEYEKRTDKESDATLEIDTSKFFLNRVPFNSPETDFGPAFYKNGILFVSAFSQDSKSTVHQGTGESFYKFYYASRKSNGSFNTPVQTFKSVNTSKYEGPVSLTPGDSTIYFVKNNLSELGTKSKNKNLVLQLVEGKIIEDEIVEIKNFLYDDQLHTFTHPSISEDGKELYFASNLDSTHGGSDIFVSHWQNGKWSSPENLGSIVNSIEDEVYPFIAEDGKLYFASAGRDSKGGLDVFVTQKVNGKWIVPTNIGEPFNSIFDDFSFIINNLQGQGYLSSNRATSLGSDDIFYFQKVFKNQQEEAEYKPFLITIINKDNFNPQVGNKIKGNLHSKNGTSYAGQSLQLLDINKHLIKRSYLTQDGTFSFSNIKPDNYLLVHESKSLDAIPTLAITHKPIAKVDHEEIRAYNIGQVLKDSLEIQNNNFVVGKLVATHPTNSDETVSLILVDTSGKVLKRVEVGEENYFIFRNLPPDNYYVLTEDHNPNYTCSIFYHSPDVSKGILKEDLEAFHYKHLERDSTLENNIIIHGQVKVNHPSNTTILLLDESDNVIDKGTVNSKGYFVFRELASENMHVIVLNDHPLHAYTHSTIYQKDESMYEIKKEEILKKLPYDESDLKKRLTVNGKLTLGEKPLPNTLLLLVDENNNVVADASTNAHGYFAFHHLDPDDFYLVVNENEPGYKLETNINVDDEALLLTKEAFSYKKIKGEEFSLQGKAYASSSKKALEDEVILLIDPEGHVLEHAVSTKEGNFHFTHLVPDNYTILFNKYDKDKKIAWKLLEDESDKLQVAELGEGNSNIVTKVNEYDNAFQVFILFPYNISRLGVNYQQKIKNFLKSIPSTDVIELELHGFTDMKGSDTFNFQLAKKRIKSCKTFIKKYLGQNNFKITEIPQGKTGQFVDKNGKYDPALNRRVELKIKK